jgi:putative tricarboxylic transport membrane protein
MQKRTSWIALFLVILLLLAGCSTPSAAPSKQEGSAAPAAWKPNSTLEFVAGGGPGGGYDTLLRTMEKTLTESKLSTSRLFYQ